VKTLEILLIALGLAMDAFAVSIASGATMKRLEIKNALKMGLFFGGFQTFMPVIGWFAGIGMKTFITGWDHWLAFGLLTFVGGKMIHEALCHEKSEESANSRPFDTGALLILALATSIDALAVGITFSVLSVSILVPVLVIGLVTFCFSVAGVQLGVKGGHFFENKVEIIGGLILFAIGLKILLGGR
jgi:putative Mn2+ efflux pump MntP